MKKFTQPPYIHIYDFVVALIIVACGLYALYLMFTSPYEGGMFRTAVRPIALGIISVLFGIYHFRFAWQHYKANK